MAKVVELGQYSKAKALAILDDDPTGHAEWHNNYAQSPEVKPGDEIIIEWDELYTMGTGETATTHDYANLPPGKFRFHVWEITALGEPTGVEASLEIIVMPPVWQRPFFWMLVTLCAMTITVSAGRYYTWRKMRYELARVERQRELEQERLRIARDIHDDLGARATQISILSSMSPNNPAFPANARSDLNRIFDLSRELIMALYQTIWAVNPENDNLYALGNYVRQMADHLCGPAQLRYRLHVEDLPRQVQVSSQVRHNIIMAIKEAIHNVIKHAKAPEITIQVMFDGKTLGIVIQDDGCGFDLASAASHNGLANMKHRLQDIGGACLVESQPGHGTIIRLQLDLPPVREDSSSARVAHGGNANNAQINHE
jgi:signal transduction histidine kinase